MGVERKTPDALCLSAGIGKIGSSGLTLDISPALGVGVIGFD